MLYGHDFIHKYTYTEMCMQTLYRHQIKSTGSAITSKYRNGFLSYVIYKFLWFSDSFKFLKTIQARSFKIRTK